MRCGLTLLLGLAAAATGVSAAERLCEVNVNVALTEEGREVSPPSPEHPAYYFPVLANYREDDGVETGEKAPAREVLTRPLVGALMREGYHVASAKTPPPTLLLVFYWGAVSAEIEEMSDDPDEPDPVPLNEKEMLTLVGANATHHLQLSIGRQRVLNAAAEDRYFVIVTAYDYAEARRKKKTLLWQARMSTPAAGVTMPDVVKALVDNGAPRFGRETKQPVWARGKVRKGNVEIGEAVVVPETGRDKAPSSNLQAPEKHPEDRGGAPNGERAKK
jgi:hypothetical protein